MSGGLLQHSAALHARAQGRSLTNPLLEAFSQEWGNFHSFTEHYSGVGVLLVFSNTCLLLRAEIMHFLPAEVAEWPTPLVSCQGSLLHGWSDRPGPLFQAPALTPAGAVHPVSKAVLNCRSPSNFRRGAVNTLSARLAAAVGNCSSSVMYTRSCGYVPVVILQLSVFSTVSTSIRMLP